MKMIKRNFIILGLILLSSKSYSDESVVIYYTDWATSRYFAWTEERVREYPSILIKLIDPLEILVLKTMLEDDSVRILSTDQNDTSTNITIVIDISYNETIKKTYLINQFVFYEKGDVVRYKTPKILLEKHSLRDHSQYLKYFE